MKIKCDSLDNEKEQLRKYEKTRKKAVRDNLTDLMNRKNT